MLHRFFIGKDRVCRIVLANTELAIPIPFGIQGNLFIFRMKNGSFIKPSLRSLLKSQTEFWKTEQRADNS